MPHRCIAVLSPFSYSSFSRLFHFENMAGGISPMLKFLGSAASVLVGGFLTTAVIAGAVRTTTEKRMKKISPPCRICKGKGFHPCKLCKGNTTIEWSPLHDPIAINPCICPTCDGNRVQRCLNCIGKGYAI